MCSTFFHYRWWYCFADQKIVLTLPWKIQGGRGECTFWVSELCTLNCTMMEFMALVKFHLGFFATEGALSFQIYPLFWKAVGLLEMSCNLKVIGAVCDGASPNRKFIKMHSKIDGSGQKDVTYRTIYLYDRSRFIWFFSDYPHLIKTSRNCLFNSGFGDSFPRRMWNNGKFLVYGSTFGTF